MNLNTDDTSTAHRKTVLVCHKCDQRWTAHTIIKKKGWGLTARPGKGHEHDQRDAGSMLFEYRYKPATCKKGHMYSGISLYAEGQAEKEAERRISGDK